VLGRRRQTCVECHFFVKEARGLPAGPIVLPVSEEERAKARANDFAWVKPHYTLSCHFTVWDEGFDLPPDRRHEVIAATDRRDQCFFWKYRPSMLLPAAKVLQEREARDHEAQRDRRLTIWGLWIAAVALVAQLGVQLAVALHLWPFR